jgi:hypothetical protein
VKKQKSNTQKSKTIPSCQKKMKMFSAGGTNFTALTFGKLTAFYKSETKIFQILNNKKS